MNTILTLLFLLITFAPLANANEQGICDNSNTPVELFKCLLENHPKASANKSDLQAGKFGVEQSEQRPNPSLGIESVGGTHYGQKVADTSIQYMHTFELGGKRAARIEKAQAELSAIEVGVYDSTFDIGSELALKLYRLQQANRESALVQETISTYKKILQTYKNRPALSPEQKVSQNIFELAVQDYKNKEVLLQLELAEIQTYFSSLSLASFSKISTISQSLQFNVKEVEARFNNLTSSKKGTSFQLQLAESQFKLAQAELSLQKAETWGNLEIGPIYQYHYEEGSGYPMVGVGLTLPLPIYNLNGGGKGKTLHQLKSAEYLRDFESRKAQSEWPNLESAFKQMVANIKEQSSKQEIEKNHHELEKLFYRGLVSSSLIVESHRQMVDLTQSQHEQQLRSLQLLYKAYALSGELPKDFL